MRYEVRLIHQAEKDLDDIKGKDFDLIKNKVIALSKNPRPFGSKKLINEEGYRIRAGIFRILYRIDDLAKRVFTYRIKQRKDAYRWGTSHHKIA